MESLWAWKGISAGMSLAALSFFVARDYLRAVPLSRRPGLSLAEEMPPAPPSPHAVAVGRVYVALGLAGFALAAFSAARL